MHPKATPKALGGPGPHLSLRDYLCLPYALLSSGLVFRSRTSLQEAGRNPAGMRATSLIQLAPRSQSGKTTLWYSTTCEKDWSRSGRRCGQLMAKSNQLMSVCAASLMQLLITSVCDVCVAIRYSSSTNLPRMTLIHLRMPNAEIVQFVRRFWLDEIQGISNVSSMNRSPRLQFGQKHMRVIQQSSCCKAPVAGLPRPFGQNHVLSPGSMALPASQYDASCDFVRMSSLPSGPLGKATRRRPVSTSRHLRQRPHPHHCRSDHSKAPFTAQYHGRET